MPDIFPLIGFIEIFSTIGLIFLVILVFNLMIVVHELGHYWAALWRGLKIDRFQIWFGKPWFKFERKGVQWGIGWLPLGGFVALPQMAPMEAIEGKNRSVESGDSVQEGGEANPAVKLPPISPLDKIIVAFAGPLFSFLLAVFFAVLVWIIGFPQGQRYETVVGAVNPEGVAAEAGVEVGDRILAIDGQEVSTFLEMQESIMLSTKENMELRLLKAETGETETVMATLKKAKKRWWERSEPRQIGVYPEIEFSIKSIMEDSPAAEAGLQKGEQILAANGVKLRSNMALNFLLQTGEEVELSVRNAAGEVRQVSLAARLPDLPKDFERKLAGITFAFAGEEKPEIVHQSVGTQLYLASTQIFRTIRAVTSSNSGVGVNDLAGPIGIGNMYYRLFNIDWRLVLMLSVVLNINLAILNLLPLPVLDGGHITLALLEKLRGKPANPKLLEPLYVGCALLLFAFMGYKLIQETWLIGSGKEMGASTKQEEPRFLPPEERE